MTQANIANLPTTQQPPKRKLVEKFADRYSVDANKLMGTLKATCFKAKDRPASDEEMMALLIVADQYKLNPFTKEIFAFPDKQNGIVPVVGVDGWSRIINDHPNMNGLEFRYSETSTKPEGGQSCPEWCEVVIYRKDREHATVVREYLDEVYRPPFKTKEGKTINGAWQSHTKRFLRHKALIQGARIAFGFSGIYDEDEAEGIINITPHEVPARPKLGDFQQKKSEPADLIPMIDEFGEATDNLSLSEYVGKAVAKIKAMPTRDMLDAFMEHNAETMEGFEPRSEARQAIARAFNDACANLTTNPESQPQESEQRSGAAVEPQEGWEAWVDNLCQNISTAPNAETVTDLLSKNATTLSALKDESAALYNSVNAAAKARTTTINKTPKE